MTGQMTFTLAYVGNLAERIYSFGTPGSSSDCRPDKDQATFYAHVAVPRGSSSSPVPKGIRMRIVFQLSFVGHPKSGRAEIASALKKSEYYGYGQKAAARAALKVGQDECGMKPETGTV